VGAFGYYAVTFLIAAGVSIALSIALRPLLRRYALARPNARSSHKVPTPQGGGIAVVAAVFAAVLIASALVPIDPRAIMALWPLAAGILLLAVTGAIDDLVHMPVAPRFVLQFIAVSAVVALLPIDARLVPMLPWWIERAALVIGGVYFVNLVNFMDGLDWMTVAEVVPLTACLVLILLFQPLSLACAIAVALLGAIIGFSPFNRPVAKLFLGDVGSLPIGLALFWLLVQLALHGHVVAALLLPLYYVADATVTLLRRLAHGDNVFQAHRDHFYQRATDRGFSALDVVERVFLVNVGLGALAILSVSGALWAKLVMLALGVVLVAALLVHLARGKR
jgi:UDP-N-acetylmuramyl pentapeptide phosphotransferase/UDP-N-acetylglucosamine-1-phosphate transferase